MAQRRLTPNLLGVAFAVAGLAEAWDAAKSLFGIPGAVSAAVWVVAAALWCVLTAAYLVDCVRAARTRSELTDPTFAPFISLLTIVPMLLGVALAEHSRTAGVVIFLVSLTATAALGGWLIGQWIISDLTLAQWHAGYFLPTVAGGYLAAASSANLGYSSLARVMFGYGTVSWLVLGSILLQRLFTQPLLPTPLLPTMAIQMAPPVVAGVAWFDINGNHVDALALGLGGYAALMAMVQVRLIVLYRTVPFGPGWWAFGFSYAAVFVDSLHWLAAEHVTHGYAWSWPILAVVSAAVLTLLARTAIALKRGTFLPGPGAVGSAK